jgi:hypothetical protein
VAFMFEDSETAFITENSRTFAYNIDKGVSDIFIEDQVF